MNNHHKILCIQLKDQWASILGVFFLFFLSLLSQSGHSQAVYTFENLSENQYIHGKDNWVNNYGQGKSWIKKDTNAANGTMVVEPFPTIAVNYYSYLSRANDSSFAFPSFTGLEYEAVFQFDCTGDGQAIFALGRDLNENGRLQSDSGELGPQFGVKNQEFVLQIPDTSPVIKFPFGPGNARFDWYQVQLIVDFTANDFNGSGSLSYRNLSDGASQFTPIASMQDINLQLKQLPSEASPDQWDQMWLFLLAGGGNEPGVDNLSITSGPVKDTSTVSVAEDLGEDIQDIRIKIGPNPSSGKVFIQLPKTKEPLRYELIDLNGKLIAQQELTDDQPIELKASQGFYFIRLFNERGEKLYEEKLVILP